MRFALNAWLSSALVILAILQSGCQRVENVTPVDPLAAYPWLYLRDNLPVQEDEQVVSIIAVGDIQLGRNVDDPSRAFQAVQSWLSSADLTIGNLECTLSPVNQDNDLSQEPSPYSPILLSADPQAAEWLGWAGFDILNLANNHALDAGSIGLGNTALILEEAGIQTIGIQQPQQTLAAPLIIKVNGVRLAFLGVNAVSTPTSGNILESGNSGWVVTDWDEESFTASIQAAHAQADIVIVSMHWGYEFQQNIDPAQKRIAEKIFESGAQIIIGHHPHVLQPTEVYSTSELTTAGTIQVSAYSLGNFVFDQGQDGTNTGLALRILVDQLGLRAIQELPVQAGSKPRLLPPLSQVPKTETIAAVPEMAAFTCDAADCTSLFLSNEALETIRIAPSAIFTSGEADLTGDGQTETIELGNGQIVVRSGGSIQWQSPSNWDVVDLALGDPDQDGRADILAAFWKSDSNGIRRSHPFLIRQQAGRYQEVWGGSAVSDPILEVEVEDLDGDGFDELIVLEQHPASQKKAVTVWRWHGWGFSLDWRGPEGDYESLKVVETAGKTTITVVVR